MRGALCKAFGAVLLLLLAAGGGRSARAEPCLLAYPMQNTIFRFDPGRYEVVGPSDPRYNPAYGKAGVMLWDKLLGRIPYEVYQAPSLANFEPTGAGRNVFFTSRSSVSLAVDGFYEAPRQLNDIVVQFLPQPLKSKPRVYVDGRQADGLRYVIPRMIISTPTGNGFYSDTVVLNVQIEWGDARSLEIIVYGDKNGNLVFDGTPCYYVELSELPVPTESTSWGRIKSLFR